SRARCFACFRTTTRTMAGRRSCSTSATGAAHRPPASRARKTKWPRRSGAICFLQVAPEKSGSLLGSSLGGGADGLHGGVGRGSHVGFGDLGNLLGGLAHAVVGAVGGGDGG